MRQFLDGLAEATGVEFDPDNPDQLIGRLGTVARFVGATLRDTANPTILKAGYKHNVIPQTAEAYVDSRFIRKQDLPRIIGLRVETPVKSQQTVMWTDLAVTSDDRRQLSITVQPDASLADGACVVQTGSGTLEIGVDAQLEAFRRAVADHPAAAGPRAAAAAGAP